MHPITSLALAETGLFDRFEPHKVGQPKWAESRYRVAPTAGSKVRVAPYPSIDYSTTQMSIAEGNASLATRSWWSNRDWLRRLQRWLGLAPCPDFRPGSC